MGKGDHKGQRRQNSKVMSVSSTGDRGLRRPRIWFLTGHSKKQMDDLEPTVRIRELKRDKVDFVLENVDLAYAALPVPLNLWLPRMLVPDSQTPSAESSWQIYRPLVSGNKDSE
jgi:hypothetical protein